jgi:FRG domain
MAMASIPTTTVRSLPDFVRLVADDAELWSPIFPWFRGETADTPTPLVPRVFRPPKPGFHFDENNLLQSFRRRARLLGLPVVPRTEETDQWLFLARHVGLPTRLLDWTEGALLGLYFALADGGDRPLVWMLNPHKLNMKTDTNSLPNVFPITWTGPTPSKPLNPAVENIQAAWRLGQGAFPLPVAIEPTNIHPRMNAQHSYFTVHGDDKRPLSELVGAECLRRYSIEFADRDEAIRQLRMMGVARSTILPDAEALSEELRHFMVVPD